MGRAHEKEAAGMFYFGAKNQKNLYKGMQIGNTIISKINRQQNQAQDSTQYYTYLNLTRKIFPP